VSNKTHDVAKSDSLLKTFASGAGMDTGKLKSLLDEYDIPPVEIAVG
jgi:hypothetical protein